MEQATLKRFQRIERFLWAAVLVALPVTSFRYLPFMGTDTQVRPLSLIPAVFLLFALALRSLQERRLIFWTSKFQPLFIFIMIAVASSAIGFLFAPVNLYSYTYSSRVLRAWLSFGVGLVFLVTSMAMNQDERDLKFTVKWIYVGLVAEVAWSLVQTLQIYVIHFSQLDLIQKTVMMAGLPPNGRISGLALEPSWLAAQVITIYLPWAFAALLKNYYWGWRRWLMIVILAACAYLLIFTFSRAGVLTALGAVILTFIIAGRERIRQAWKWFFSPLLVKNLFSTRLLEVAVRIVIIFALLVGLAGGIYILSRNKYFAQIWQSREKTLTNYFIDIYAGPRLAYSWAGWTIFEQHPWTGVGLGAAGLYLPQAIPDWAHFNNPDIAQLLSPGNQTYPNIKNLYIRLLSETGILGFWSFIVLYALTLGVILKLLRSRQKVSAFLGTASLLAWISLVVLGVTQDSLAMPIIWIPFGILIGMTARQVVKSATPRTEAYSSVLILNSENGRMPEQQEKL
jgi:O-antigen ligase